MKTLDKSPRGVSQRGNHTGDFVTFMEPDNDYEVKADGSYQKKTDIRRFKNYRQFRKLMDSFIDFKQDIPDIERPVRVQCRVGIALV